MIRSSKKQKRHFMLREQLDENPFLTDEELAAHLGVSVPTIRLDRMELNIAELKERVKKVATDKYVKGHYGLIGEIVDIIPGRSAISVLDTSEEMVCEKTGIVWANHIFAAAETLAAALEVGSIKVANLKYKKPVKAGERLIAKAEIKKTRENDFIIWVFVFSNMVEVFRAKFSILPQQSTFV